MALAPWNVLAGGKIRTDAEEQKRRETGEKGREVFAAGWERTPDERKVCLALEKVAGEIGAKSITAGVFRFLVLFCRVTFAYIRGSRYRVRVAEDSLRLPHHRRTQGRAPVQQSRGTGNQPVAQADRVPGEHLAT